MTVLPLPLLRITSLGMLVLSGLWLAWLVFLGQRASLRSLLAAHRGAVARDLRYLRVRLSADSVLFFQALLLGVSVMLGVAASPVFGALGGAIVLFVRPYLVTLRARRTTELETQLDAWLLSLASALRASPALGDAIAQTTELIAPPLRDELSLLVREHELGTPLDQAFERLARRVDSRTLSSALSAMRIARNAGGELSRTLERAAGTLREMARLEGVLRTKTAEAKAQAFVLGAVPWLVAALLDQMNPTYLVPLYTTRTGYVLLGSAIALWLASIFLARSILDVDL